MGHFVGPRPRLRSFVTICEDDSSLYSFYDLLVPLVIVSVRKTLVDAVKYFFLMLLHKKASSPNVKNKKGIHHFENSVNISQNSQNLS
jgi:hypothetical protein